MGKSINQNIPEPQHPENLKALLSAPLEVGLVYGLLLLAWRWFSNTSLAEWEKNIFHLPILSTVFALIAMPIVLIQLTGRSTRDFGLSFDHLAYQLRTGTKAFLILVPFLLLVPILNRYGISPMQLPGALILAAGFGIAIPILGLLLRDNQQPEHHPVPTDLKGAEDRHYINTVLCILLGLVITLAIVRPASHGPGKIIYSLIAVGFGEEFFFRGYLQSRLNQAFGRPYRLWTVSFGWGLILASALFALAHGFNPHGNFYWSIWTFPLGLIFGGLREQTGGVLASALVHGTAVTVALAVS